MKTVLIPDFLFGIQIRQSAKPLNFSVRIPAAQNVRYLGVRYLIAVWGNQCRVTIYLEPAEMPRSDRYFHRQGYSPFPNFGPYHQDATMGHDARIVGENDEEPVSKWQCLVSCTPYSCEFQLEIDSVHLESLPDGVIPSTIGELCNRDVDNREILIAVYLFDMLGQIGWQER